MVNVSTENHGPGLRGQNRSFRAVIPQLKIVSLIKHYSLLVACDKFSIFFFGENDHTLA